MRIYRVIIFLFCLSWGVSGRAQSGKNDLQPRILLLLDKSSSMINKWDAGKLKSKVADEIILRLMDSVYAVNRNVEFSLRVFGAQYTVDENNCRDTKNEVPFRKDNRLQMEYRLEDLKPLGVTSIAYALMQAADNDLVDITHNAYSIILITDGGESCGGDICEVMQQLKESKVFFRPYIVSLEHSTALKTAYDCMGDYLEVTKQGDVGPAVKKIVDAFRPVIMLTPQEYTKIREVAAETPRVLGVTIPKVKMTETVRTTLSKVAVSKWQLSKPDVYIPKPTRVPDMPEGGPEPIPSYEIERLPMTFSSTIGRIPITQETKAPVKVPVFEPLFVADLPDPVAITPLRSTSLKPAPVSLAIGSTPIRNVAPYKPVFLFDKPEPDQFNKVQTIKPRRFMSILVMEYQGRPLRPVRVPALPKPIFEEEAPEAPEVAVEREDAKETTVRVYFTNGKGKFYETTPQVFLLDPKTGKLIKRFFRMVDANGQPDPQTGIPAGTYNLTFADNPTLVYNNIVVEKDKENKIIIKVAPASLVFEYVGTDRPVSEFVAEVIERNKANGRVEYQKCTDRIEYEPGNYHVTINTFPQDVRNLDLDFGEKVIRILQPGFAKFEGEGIPLVKLYQQLGDKYRQFTSIKMDDPKARHLRLQPGKYQAHFNKGPGGPAASEKVVVFIVKATEETKVILQ